MHVPDRTSKTWAIGWARRSAQKCMGSTDEGADTAGSLAQPLSTKETSRRAGLWIDQTGSRLPAICSPGRRKCGSRVGHALHRAQHPQTCGSDGMNSVEEQQLRTRYQPTAKGSNGSNLEAIQFAAPYFRKSGRISYENYSNSFTWTDS